MTGDAMVVPRSATVVVAAADSSEASRRFADFICDSEGDQEQINAAVAALPAAGGTVLLMEGTYSIQRAGEALGGVIINRSRVTLAGQGAATRLVLAPRQNINVVRIIGSGVGEITIRDLYVDANRDQNDRPWGDPNVSHGRFEVCGIKGWARAPGGPDAESIRDITIRNCHIVNAQRLGIMLHGIHMRVIDNVIGNAGSDAVELLGGPGEIRGNLFHITGQTHVAVGSDAGDNILMVNNTVHVGPEGRLDIAFRSWEHSLRHVITGNLLSVDQGGRCSLAMDIRGTMATITGNVIYTHPENEPMRLKITGGHTIVTGNTLENVVIDVDDTTGGDKPIIVRNNIMHNASIAHRRGLLITED